MTRKKETAKLLGIRAYARHRKVSQTAVQKAIKSGRITVRADGKIDVAKADKQWEENSSPTPPPNAKPATPTPAADTDAKSFAKARARKENALAQIRESELADKLGQTLTIDYAAEQLAACLDSVVKPVRSLASRLIRELARAGVLRPNVESRARNVIDIEIDRILEELQQAGDNLPIDRNGDDAPSSPDGLAA